MSEDDSYCYEWMPFCFLYQRNPELVWKVIASLKSGHVPRAGLSQDRVLSQKRACLKRGLVPREGMSQEWVCPKIGLVPSVPFNNAIFLILIRHAVNVMNSAMSRIFISAYTNVLAVSPSMK